MYDLFVVGAGPVGCYFTQKIGEFDYRLIEEHREVGVPVQCAGLVGERIFAYAEKSYLNEINGAYIRYGNDTFSLRKKGVAYVLDREQFDKNVGRDLTISFKERFIAARRKNDAIEIKTTKGVYYAKYLVGCDGPCSQVRQYVSARSPTYLRSLQYTMAYEHDDDMISFFLKPFSWIIPETKGVCRVGVISTDPARDMPSLDGKVIRKTGGLIPIGRIQPYKDKIFLIGDAAAQVKPLTGGGLYYGMRAADIAGDLFLRGNIEKYGTEWKRSFGREISLGLLGRRMYEGMSDKDVATFYNFIKKNKGKIEESCKFDSHSSFLKIILKSPKIWSFFLKNILKEFILP
jgi:flavin-dependent dehydrogenase